MLIQLEDVHHSYTSSGPSVLRGVSLTVQPGDRVALMGPSGSGKSTILAILGLLTPPTTGVVRFGEAALGSRRQTRLRRHLRSAHIGWVFQTANAFPNRTALSNVGMDLRARGYSPRDAVARARQCLEDVGLGAVVDQRARTLSGGELQRLCIARAVASSPALIVADEPTGQLDEATSLSCLDVMFEVLSDDATLVLATHDQLVAGRCERIERVVNGVLAAG